MAVSKSWGFFFMCVLILRVLCLGAYVRVTDSSRHSYDSGCWQRQCLSAFVWYSLKPYFKHLATAFSYMRVALSGRCANVERNLRA